MKLVGFIYCSIVLLLGGAKCTVSLVENEFKDTRYTITDDIRQEYPKNRMGVKRSAYKDPRYALTEDIQQKYSEHHMGVKRSTYKDLRYTLTNDAYKEYSAENMGVERSTYKKNEEHYSDKKYPPGCPDNLGPCTCENTAIWVQVLEVNCKNVAGEDELSDVFRNAIYHDTHLHKFTLTGNPNIRVLHAGVFQHITFDEVQIGYNNIEKVERGALDLMKSKVESLIFHRANFHNMEDFPFDEVVTFQKLQNLDFSKNRLPAFPDMISESLTYVNFGLNPINSIKQEAFRGLPNLKYIKLAGTNIGQIYPGTFKGLPILEEIDLTGNSLHELPAGTIITDSLKLKKLSLEHDLLSVVEANSITFNPFMLVDLADNPLSTLPENVWRPLFEQGGTIGSGKLYLQCDCSLAWLVLEPMWLNNLTSARCYDGEFITMLDPSLFEEC